MLKTLIFAVRIADGNKERWLCLKWVVRFAVGALQILKM
jgi:hypothetical protein